MSNIAKLLLLSLASASVSAFSSSSFYVVDKVLTGSCTGPFARGDTGTSLIDNGVSPCFKDDIYFMTSTQVANGNQYRFASKNGAIEVDVYDTQSQCEAQTPVASSYVMQYDTCYLASDGSSRKIITKTDFYNGNPADQAAVSDGKTFDFVVYSGTDFGKCVFTAPSTVHMVNGFSGCFTQNPDFLGSYQVRDGAAFQFISQGESGNVSVYVYSSQAACNSKTQSELINSYKAQYNKCEKGAHGRQVFLSKTIDVNGGPADNPIKVSYGPCNSSDPTYDVGGATYKTMCISTTNQGYSTLRFLTIRIRANDVRGVSGLGGKVVEADGSVTYNVDLFGGLPRYLTYDKTSKFDYPLSGGVAVEIFAYSL